jgi:dihydrodipicolinate synthase/N-acetylneuraminate lyase
MTDVEQFRGVYAAVPTPLCEDESIDYKGLEHLVNFYADSRCHEVVVLGSGGEFPYFTFDERIQIVKAAVKAVQGIIPLLAGSGFSCLAETKLFLKEAGMLDLDGFLVILPTYHPIAFDDVQAFYQGISAISKKPIFYYHYPQMTELCYTPEQLARIFAIDGLAGIKESSLSLPEVRKHLAAMTKENFAVFCGNSFSLSRVLDMGGAGTICQIPSFAPGLVVDCYEAWKAGEKQKSKMLQARILDLLPVLNSFDIPAGIQKLGFSILSRLPFSMKNRNPSRHAVIKEILRQLGHPITAKVRSQLPQITGRDRHSVTLMLPQLR